MSETAYGLSDLVEISRDGIDFYEEIAQKVSDKKLSKAFAQMALAKSSFANEVSSELKSPQSRRGKTPRPKGELHQAYGELRRESGKMKISHLALLEQTESVFQHSVQKIVMDRGNSCVIRVRAKQYVSSVEAFKTELRAKKRDLD